MTELLQSPPSFKHHWKCKELRITHLFFDDDALFFCHADKDSIQFLMDTIHSFGKASGLNPNIQKSHCYMAATTNALKEWTSENFGIPFGTLPFKFLGVPLITSKLSINDCVPLIQKIQARILTWTSRFLSCGGRVTLIKPVLFAIQSYWCAHLLLPKAVLKQLNSILLRFLWKGSDQKGGARVSWDQVCTNTDEGGLGIKNLTDWNKSQMIYHLWQVVRFHPTSLWANWIKKTILKGKHFWTTSIPSDCSWTWRKVLKLRAMALPMVEYKIGNGRLTSLWSDPWYQHQCINDTNDDNMIHQSGLGASAKVSDIIVENGWQLPIVRSRLHHVSASLTAWIANFDYQIQFNQSVDDQVCWDGLKEDKVNAKAIWLRIKTTRQHVRWKDLVWHRLKIPRYAFIQWLAMHDKLPTLSRLHGFEITNEVQCFFCIMGMETQDHLFLNCPYSTYVTTKLFNLVMADHLPNTWHHLIDMFLQLRDPVRTMAYLAMQVYIYHIWRERNARAHDKGIFGPAKLLKVVILVPTQELALQTSQVCEELSKHLQIEVMVTTGGTSLKDDIARLYQPVHLLLEEY